MTLSPIVIFVAAAVAGVVMLAVAGTRRRQARERFIDDFRFPPGVRQRVLKRYPHLTDDQLDLVFHALRDYFHLCRKARRRLLAMPSQVVDVAWHEFILFTRNYQAFCSRSLGRFLHHTPTEAMADRTIATEGIKRTWRLACLREGIDPKAATAIPLLFAIDGRLGIEDGFHYVLNCTHMVAAANSNGFCASHIGCGSGCGGGCAGSGCSGDAGGGDGCGGGGD
ncbi:MAG: glycine-rich domain-containing protein [Burkholderiaceae bacterium]